MFAIHARITLLATDDGGRGTAVEAQSTPYLPHLRAADGELLGVRLRLAARTRLDPGSHAEATIEALYPGVDYSSLREGTSFDIVEGSRTVGSGIVLRRESGPRNHRF